MFDYILLVQLECTYVYFSFIARHHVSSHSIQIYEITVLEFRSHYYQTKRNSSTEIEHRRIGFRLVKF